MKKFTADINLQHAESNPDVSQSHQEVDRTTFTVEHGLGTMDLVCTLYEQQGTDFVVVMADMSTAGLDRTRISLLAIKGVYKLVVVG